MIMPLIRCSLLSKYIYLFEYQIIEYMNNFKTNDNKRQGFLKDKNHKLLYVGVDNEILYYYYNIKR